MKFFVVYLLLVCSTINLVESSTTSIGLAVNYLPETGGYDVVHRADDSYDAYGNYFQNYNSSGWYYLDVFMQMEVDSAEDYLHYSRAMGFVEGYLSCQQIKDFYPNFYSDEFGTDEPGDQTINFIQENYDWMKKMAADNGASDDYWFTVQSIMMQVEGSYDGYLASTCNEPARKENDSSKVGGIYATIDNPTLMHFLLMNAWGDLYQIAAKFNEPGYSVKGNHPNWKQKSDGDTASSKNSLQYTHGDYVERCSAIVKLLDDKSDVVYGHATWDSYEAAAPRIFKHYNFPLMRNGYAEHHYEVYFSSSPAILSSVDDFYTVSGYAKLGVQETTNNLYNLSLLDLVVPQSVLSWMRVTASNQMAKSGSDWGTQFSRYHSGTYTNQWMAIDLKLFSPGSTPADGFLTVFEEVPGLVHVEDQTQRLISDGYWPSYNIPFYDDITIASGYADLCEKDATRCYDTAPRASIFREYQDQVNDVFGGQWILGYNSFQNDTASLNDSCNAIACRGDLEPRDVERGAYGAIDAKVTTVLDSKREVGDAPVLYARVGPSHDQQPVFCWSDMKDADEYVHVGQPDCFDYAWQVLPPASAA